MRTLSAAVHEAYGEAEPYLPTNTTLCDRPLRGFSYAHCYKDRDLRTHENLLGFRESELLQGSRLLVVGSGATRRFERELAAVRSDLSIVSIDPLLRDGIQTRQLESIRIGGYRGFGWGDLDIPREIENGEAYYRRAAICGGFALGASSERRKDNYLPFRDASFNVVLGLHSLPQHLATPDIPAYLSDIVRIMKPGGHALFFPILNEDFDITKQTLASMLSVVDATFAYPAVSYFDSPTSLEATGLRFAKAF